MGGRHPELVEGGFDDLSEDGRSRCADSVQCWAHSRTGARCTRMIKSREGEPVPIPYCDAHLESGDGALKVVNHPFAGKALVAR